jgi:hypothetical protein
MSIILLSDASTHFNGDKQPFELAIWMYQDEYYVAKVLGNVSILKLSRIVSETR